MIIPMRCFSCNTMLSGKWMAYKDRVKELRKTDGRTADDDIPYLTPTTKKTAEGRAMDELGFTKECCRRHLLTHVDLL